MVLLLCCCSGPSCLTSTQRRTSAPASSLAMEKLDKSVPLYPSVLFWPIAQKNATKSESYISGASAEEGPVELLPPRSVLRAAEEYAGTQSIPVLLLAFAPALPCLCACISRHLEARYSKSSSASETFEFKRIFRKSAARQNAWPSLVEIASLLFLRNVWRSKTVNARMSPAAGPFAEGETSSTLSKWKNMHRVSLND